MKKIIVSTVIIVVLMGVFVPMAVGWISWREAGDWLTSNKWKGSDNAIFTVKKDSKGVYAFCCKRKPTAWVIRNTELDTDEKFFFEGTCLLSNGRKTKVTMGLLSTGDILFLWFENGGYESFERVRRQETRY